MVCRVHMIIVNCSVFQINRLTTTTDDATTETDEDAISHTADYDDDNDTMHHSTMDMVERTLMSTEDLTTETDFSAIDEQELLISVL